MEPISPTGSASDTISSSYDSSDSDSASEVSEVSPLPAERPTAPLEAVRYDTVRSLWRPKTRTTSSEQIRKALVDFWEVIRTIRDRWKTDTAAVKQAEEAKKNNELPLLRDRVKNQRDMMESAVKAALHFGHPNIIRMYVYFSVTTQIMLSNYSIRFFTSSPPHSSST